MILFFLLLLAACEEAAGIKIPNDALDVHIKADEQDVNRLAETD